MSTPRFTPPSLRATPPDPGAVRLARICSGHTQAKCASLVHVALRTWQQWESGERRMPPCAWELFVIKSAEDTYR